MTIIYETKHLSIRTVQMTDVHDIITWKNDDYLRLMSIGEHTLITLENQQQDIEHCLNENIPYYIIVLKETGLAIGYMRLNYLDSNEQVAWLRFGLGTNRGHGYAFEALNGLIHNLFQHNVHRIEAEVYDFNKPSSNVLTKLGFTHEGTRRQAHLSQDKWCDVQAFGLLKTDVFESNL